MPAKDQFSISRNLEVGGKVTVISACRLSKSKDTAVYPSFLSPFGCRWKRVRQFDGRAITEDHVKLLSKWNEGRDNNKEIPFIPARIVLQDFTGVPVVVDLRLCVTPLKIRRRP